MRFILIVTFLFNTAFMPISGLAHESSHESHEGKTKISWSDDEASNGLFQIAHDDHHTHADSSDLDDHSSNHQCHHISVIGIVASVPDQAFTKQQSFKATEPLYFIQSFLTRVEYPPKNT